MASSTASNVPNNPSSEEQASLQAQPGEKFDASAESANQEIHQDSKVLRPVTFKPTVYTRMIKPIGDRTAALIALIVLAVPMLLIAATVYLSMGRPLLFQQRRVGLDGKVFYVMKFRTMKMDRRGADKAVHQDQRITHKTEKDPRHTPLGQFLRRYSLDELPQLFNILRGEMSVIGPRPELESVVAKHYQPGLHARHRVRPGLTGLWQISARGEGHMHENGQWDLDYVESISLMTDLKILVKTPFVMFGRNAGN